MANTKEKDDLLKKSQMSLLGPITNKGAGASKEKPSLLPSEICQLCIFNPIDRMDNETDSTCFPQRELKQSAQMKKKLQVLCATMD